MQLHRPDVTDDRECGNLELLCTLNTPSPERMRYFLELCKEKKTAPFSKLKIFQASPSPSGKRRANRRTEEVGGYELSLRNSLRNASSVSEFGQPYSWPRRAAPTAR